MTVLDGLLDSRRDAAGEGPLSEAFDTRLHPHVPHGPHGGQFAKTLTPSKTKTAARVTPARRGLPQGSGPARPEGRLSSGSRVARSTVNKTRTTVDGVPRAPGAGAERTPASRPRKLTEHELPQAVGKGRWTKSANASVDALHKGTIEDTEHAHRLPGSGGKLGPYKPERIELHARIARALMQGAGTHSKPEAHFMAGGPASGKSRMLKDGAVHVPGDAVDVNPDIVKTMLPEYHALIARGDKAASSKVHEESSHIAKLVMNLALSRKHHVIVDGVGNSGPGKFAGKIAQARDHGHATSVHYATVATDEALKRSEARAAKTGRHVPEGYLRSAHADVSRIFLDEIQHMPGVHVQAFDTGMKRTTKLFEKSANGRGRVVHAKGFARFAGKARERA